MPGVTRAASTIARVMSLPMAADCLRHFWLALARPKLFQSGVFAGEWPSPYPAVGVVLPSRATGTRGMPPRISLRTACAFAA